MDTLEKLNSVMILSLEVCHFTVQFKVGKEGRILGLLTIRILRQVSNNGIKFHQGATLFLVDDDCQSLFILGVML